MLASFFVATPGSRIKLETVAQDFPTVQAFGVDTNRLAGLAQTLLNLDETEALEQVSNDQIEVFGPDGPWLYLVDLEVMRRLAALSEFQIRQFALAWAAARNPEPGSRWSPDDIIRLTEQLSGMANQAVQQNARMYVLMTDE